MVQYKLFTDSDLDGVSCGIIAKLVFGDNIDVIYTGPKAIDNEIETFLNSKEYEKYNKIFITDLSVSDENAYTINTLVHEYGLKLLGHHRSAYYLNKYKWARVCESLGTRKTCGTELFWEYLKETINDFAGLDVSYIDKYVNCVRLWDTWEWTTDTSDDSALARELSILLGIYGSSKFIDDTIIKLSSSDNLINTTDEILISIIEEKKKRYVQSKAKCMQTIKWDGYTVGVVFAEENISDLGNYLCKFNPEIDFAAIINFEYCVISMRAIKDIDLSEIAKKYGGGGHPKSAGFNFDRNIKNLIITNIFKNDNSQIEGI